MQGKNELYDIGMIFELEEHLIDVQILKVVIFLIKTKVLLYSGLIIIYILSKIKLY